MESKVLTLFDSWKSKNNANTFKDKDTKWFAEQTVAQLIKLFVKLPFNLDVYLLQSWWWISATTTNDYNDDNNNNYIKETKRWFQNYTAKESRVGLARYVVQEPEKQDKKIKKIYVTQVPKEQWLPLTQLQLTKDTDDNLIFPKPMIACDCWTQSKAQIQKKKNQENDPLKIKDLLHELTNANKITNSVLINENAISQDDLHDMQFLTQETVANYWTKETENKETTLTEMMACFPAYNQRFDNIVTPFVVNGTF